MSHGGPIVFGWLRVENLSGSQKISCSCYIAPLYIYSWLTCQGQISNCGTQDGVPYGALQSRSEGKLNGSLGYQGMHQARICIILVSASVYLLRSRCLAFVYFQQFSCHLHCVRGTGFYHGSPSHTTKPLTDCEECIDLSVL
jgi:hypothetical protein